MVSLSTKIALRHQRLSLLLEKQLAAFAQTLLLFCVIFISIRAQAVTVTAERQIIPINETLRLEIVDNSGAQLDKIDLSGIEANFTIVNQSSQTSFSMVNGRTESRKSLVLMLAPQKLGSMLIPPLTLDQQKSKPIKIKVIKALPLASELKDQSVIVESEVDRDEVLIGSQLIYTFRVIYRVQLNNAEIDGINLDNADVTALEDKNYTRSINGQNYNVTEKRYAIFFNKAGEMTIPSQSLIALLPSNPRRSFGFDPFARGKELRLESKPLTIDVLASPANNAGSNRSGNWLAAQDIQLTEDWPAGKQEARVAEPLTRSISIVAKGLPADLLPSIVPENIDGMNSYPEKPELVNQEFIHGIASKRTETIAMVPTKAGTFTLPAIELQWWNTLKNRVEVASLPARTITVLPAVQSSQNNTAAIDPQAAANSPASITEQNSDKNTHQGNSGNTSFSPFGSNSDLANNADTIKDKRLWMPLALIAFAGWTITLLYLLFRPRGVRTIDTSEVKDNQHQGNLKALQKQLELACKNNDASAAKRLLQQWLSAIKESNPKQQVLKHPDLDRAINLLDEFLFNQNKQATSWDGGELASAIKSAAKANRSGSVDKGTALSAKLEPLYPNG
jgi:hypothetical protein